MKTPSVGYYLLLTLYVGILGIITLGTFLAITVYFKEAQPYLEKAHELNPADTNTMVSLKQLYARLNETAKYDAIKAKLEGK